MTAVIATLLLTACNRAPEPAPATRLTDAAPGAAADPLVQAILTEPLLTDLDLRAMANADAVRPPPRPYSAMIPLDGVVAAPPPTFGTLRPAPAPVAGGCADCGRLRDQPLATIAAASPDPRLRACATRLTSSAAWANRLIGIPLYRNARVIEGVGAPGCATARFSAAEPVQLLLEYHATQARGFTLRHRSDGAAHILSGDRTDAHFILHVAPRTDGGTDAVLLTAM